MSNTGHRSVDGVRCYKRIGEEQKKHMSSVLNSTTNGEQSNEPPECNPSNPKKPKLTTVPTMNTKSFLYKTLPHSTFVLHIHQFLILKGAQQ